MPTVDLFREVRVAISVKVIEGFRLGVALQVKIENGIDLTIDEEPKGTSRILASKLSVEVVVLIDVLKQGFGSDVDVVVEDVTLEQVPKLVGTIVVETRRHDSKINQVLLKVGKETGVIN